jgi:predicted aspartyl protease
MASRLVALLAILAMAECVQAQEPAAPPAPAPAQPAGTSPETDRLGLVLPSLTVPVMINGQGPFQFAIDSGSTTTLVSDELADRLQLPPGKSVRVHAMSGIARIRTVKIREIEVSANKLSNIELAAVPRENLDADGLLGLNLLKNQRIVMDFLARSIRIEPSTAKADPEDAARAGDEELIVVTARRRHGQLVMVDADANGQKIWVIVDSGSQASVGNLRLMSLLVKRSPRLKILPIGLTDVIGRTTNAEYTYVDRLRVGGIAIGNVPIAFADAHPFKLFDLKTKPSLLLGMETLQIFNRVNIDFASRKVTFQIAKEKLRPSLDFKPPVLP